MSLLFSEDFFLLAVKTLLVLATAVQTGLALWLLRAFSGYKVQVPPSPPAWPDVSVIVCARNEALNLRQNLPALLSQQYPGRWELLVADDASTDDTSTVLTEYQQLAPNFRSIRILQKKHPGKKQALAEAIAQAAYPNILVTDADCRPASSDWIKHMALTLTRAPQTEIALGYGPLNRQQNDPWWNRWVRFEAAHTAMMYLGLALGGMPYMGVGRNLAFKKSAFERAGGFENHLQLLSGDDDLMVNAVATPRNTAVCLHPSSFMYSEGKNSPGAWLRQKRRHLAAGTAYKWPHRMALGVAALSHVLQFFLLFLLVCVYGDFKTALLLWGWRNLTFYFTYSKVFNLLGKSRLLSQFPIYDALFAVYYGAFVPVILIGKKTLSWN